MGASPSFCRTGRQLPGREDPRFRAWLWQQSRPRPAAHSAKALEAAQPDASWAARCEPERVWERVIFERGRETQGRSGSRSGGNARRGSGTRRRSKASRPSKSRRTSRDLKLATADGAGESRTRRRLEGDAAKAVSESGVSLGMLGGAGVARRRYPASSEAGAPDCFLARGVAQAVASSGGGLWRSGQPD